MKFREENPNCKPITITLDKQEDQDVLYALLNYVPINNILKKYSDEWEELRIFLEKFQWDYEPILHQIRKSLESLR